MNALTHMGMEMGVKQQKVNRNDLTPRGYGLSTSLPEQ